MQNRAVLLFLLMIYSLQYCHAQKLLITYSSKTIYSDKFSEGIRNTAKKTITFYTLKIAGNHSEYDYLRTEGSSEPVFKTKVTTFKDYTKKEIINVNTMEEPWVGTKKSLVNSNLINYIIDTVMYEGKKALKLSFTTEKIPKFGYAICDLDLPYPDGPETIHGFPYLVVYFETANIIFKAVSIVKDNSIKVRTSLPENIKLLSNDDYWNYVMSRI